LLRSDRSDQEVFSETRDLIAAKLRACSRHNGIRLKGPETGLNLQMSGINRPDIFFVRGFASEEQYIILMS
jgi:hypothetical protein